MTSISMNKLNMQLEKWKFQDAENNWSSVAVQWSIKETNERNV